MLKNKSQAESKIKQSTQLTDVELEMMNIIWDIGPCSVHQMLEKLPQERSLAYTTVSTMVRILEQKKFVTSMKDGRGHSYQAILTKEDYEAASVARLIKNVFHGEPTQLVRRLISSEDLTDADIKEIRALIDKRHGK